MHIGVEGIGRAESKVALFESDDGERGVGAIQPIHKGEVVLRIPMRIAIVDLPEDSELVYEVKHTSMDDINSCPPLLSPLLKAEIEAEGCSCGI